jgi:hypothetical protein
MMRLCHSVNAVRSFATLASHKPARMQARMQARAMGRAAPRELELDDLVPWSKVAIMLQTAEEALRAKSAVSATLQLEAASQQHGALRAEEDSGCLRDELQTLMHAKAALVQEMAELQRQRDFLLSERELLCAQLQVRRAAPPAGLPRAARAPCHP